MMDGRVNPVDSTIEPKPPAILFCGVVCVCVRRCRREGGRGKGEWVLANGTWSPPPWMVGG